MLTELLRSLFGTERPKESKTIRAKIYSVEGDIVEFRLENDKRILIPRTEIPNSELAQRYALSGTRVIDITETQEERRIFLEKDHKEFEVYLDTGVSYRLA